VRLAQFSGVVGTAALPDALRAGGAAVGLFALCGFAPVRLLLPDALRRHELLWVLPVGACAAALELALLAYAFVPFGVALAVVLGANAVVCLVLLVRPATRPRSGPGPGPGRGLPRGLAGWTATLAPLYVALLIAAIALIPMFRSGFATVIGESSATPA
jgi:hypothetical protein